MERAQLEVMIQQMTRDIVSSCTEQHGGAVREMSLRQPATLVLVTCAFASRAKTMQLITEEYGDDLQYIVFDEDLDFDFENSMRAGNMNPQILLNKLSSAERIVLLAPKISTMVNLSRGNDAGLLEQMVLKALLWGIDVSVWLDFKPMKFKRNTFFARVLDAIDALVDMGVDMRTYDCLPAGRAQPLPTLLTERDMIAAHEAGKDRIICADGAIITPSALDAAEQFGIRIEKR
jgi:hypothetical protein